MRRDERVFCIGEDIAIPGGWGGAFTVTLGLEEEFPDRAINTPISENGFFGVALGTALMGLTLGCAVCHDFAVWLHNFMFARFEFLDGPR